MQDRDGNPLEIGDAVTVGRATPAYLTGSHGVIERFGPRNAYVRLTAAAFDTDDGRLVPFPLSMLRRGHHGNPHDRAQFSDILDEHVRGVLARAVDGQIITAEQAQRIVDLKD